MDEQRAGKPPTAEISTEAVGVLREYTGRGPTRARTMINEDVVTVLFADTLTKGERRLAENGHAERIIELRHNFQQVMREDLIAMVERGRAASAAGSAGRWRRRGARRRGPGLAAAPRSMPVAGVAVARGCLAAGGVAG